MVHMTYFILKEKKLSCSIFTMFFGGCKVYFFVAYFCFGKALVNFLVTNCSVLDIARVLNPPQ